MTRDKVIELAKSLIEPESEEINVEYERGIAELIADMFPITGRTTLDAIGVLVEIRPQLAVDEDLEYIYYMKD